MRSPSTFRPPASVVRRSGGRWLAFVGLALGLLAGCGGEAPPPRCTPDPDLIAEQRACVRDEDCPCGSGCLYGQCTARCTQDADCGEGQRCSDVGRCETPGAPPALDVEGELRLSTQVVLLGAGEARAVGIAGAAGQRVRLVAEPPLQVACEGDAFTESCFAEVDAEGRLTVRVRAPEGDDGGASALSIYPERGRPARLWARFGPRATVGRQVEPLAAGARFVGTLSFGPSGARGGALSVASEGRMVVPVTADLYPGDGEQVFVLYDGFGLLVPGGRLVGTLRGEALWLPGWRLLGAAQVGTAETELVVAPRASALSVSGERLAFEIDIDLQGGGGRPARQRLVLDLRRVGDTPPGTPPAVTPGYASPFADGRWERPVPGGWEARAAALCGGTCTPAHEAWFLCVETLAGEADPSTSLSSTDALGLSGDPACEGTTGRAAAPGLLLQMQAAADDDTTRPARYALLQDCWDDLGRWVEGPGGDDGDLSAATCLQPVRFGGRLAALTDAVLALGEAPDDGSPRPEAERALLQRAHRAVQQFLEVVTYTSREAGSARRFAAAMAEDCGDEACPSLGEEATVALRPARAVGWLLHPRYQRLLLRLAEIEGDLPEGAPTLAYTLARFGAQHAALLEQVADRARRRGERDLLAGPLAEARHLLLGVRMLAAAVADQAGTGLPTAELEAVRTQLRQFDETAGRLQALWVSEQMGEGPYGLAPGEVPLYLDRDVDRPEARAFALTNYLLDPMGQNWIGQAVERAAEAQMQVRDAWAARRLLDATAVQTAADAARYRDEMARTYGEKMQALCPVEDLTDAQLAEQVASGDLVLDPNRCFLDVSNPACAEFATPTPLTAHMVLRDVCIAAMARGQSTRAGVAGEQAANDFLDAMRAALAAPDVSASAASNPDGTWDVTVGDERFTFTEDQLAVLDFGTDTLSSDRALRGFEGFSPRDGNGSSSVSDLDGFGWLVRAQQRCTALADAAEGGEPPVQPAAPEALDRAECYRGGLGEAALAARAARTEVEVAQARLEEHYERYRIAVGTCTLQSQAKANLEAESKAFESSVAELRENISNLRAAAGALDMISGGIANTSTSSGADGALKNASGPMAAVTGAAAAGSFVMGMVADGLQKELDEKTAEHEGYMQAIQEELELRLCMNEASREMVGLRSATLEIRQAVQRLGQAVLTLENLKRQLANLQRSVAGALDDRHGPTPYQGTLWAEPALETFARRMRLARRVSYLAAVALDYERQSCNAEDYRGRALRAETPDELDALRDDMLATTANRQIGNGTVGDAFAVLSLRDDILGLADRYETAPGEPKQSAVARFRRFLLDPRFAVYEGGRYLGQLVRFDLVPPGQAVRGYGVGEGYFSRNHCAERLWSVNVGIVGEKGVSGDSTLTRIEVLKGNDFSSQWCRPEAACDGQPWQHASLNPAVNLFVDPVSQPGFLDVARGRSEAFSRVVLTGVRTDVERADVERADYAQGAQRGFAGRGLFGQYALFFPADALRVDCGADGGCGSSPSALDLTKVDDVLIRFDYVAGVRP